MPLIRDAYLRMATAAQTPLVRSESLCRLHRRLMRRIRPEFVDVDGFTLRLDPTDALHLSWNRSMPASLSWIAARARPGKVVLDVGAHIGLYALHLARRVAPHGHVYAFEPDPRNFECLSENVDLNHVDNITTIHAAVAASTGVRRMLLEDCTALSRLTDAEESGTCAVETLSIDDFVHQRRIEPSFVKIDVEGHEPEVLAGMCRLLETAADVRIVMEFAPHRLSAAGFDPSDALTPLVRYGFSMFDCRDHTADSMPLSANQLLERYSIRSRAGTDLLCQRDPTAST